MNYPKSIFNKISTITSFSLLLIHSNVLAQSESVATDPVGFVKVDITGNGYTFVGTPLVNTASFSGIATSVSTTNVKFADNSFVEGEFDQAIIDSENVAQYVFEITDESHSDVGAMIPVVSNTTDTLTLSEDVSGFISEGTKGIVRALHTLDSLFPSGAPLNTGFSAASADEILIYDSKSQSTSTYYYSSLLNGWYSGATVLNGQRSILPNQAIYIHRKSATPTSITFTGSVKMGTTAIDIYPGYNLISNLYPVSYSFDSSGLYTGNASTGVASGFSAASADEVIIYDANAVATTYYYNSLLDEWLSGGSIPAGSIKIPVGGALMINRKSTEGAFSWVVSQPF